MTLYFSYSCVEKYPGNKIIWPRFYGDNRPGFGVTLRPIFLWIYNMNKFLP